MKISILAFLILTLIPSTLKAERITARPRMMAVSWYDSKSECKNNRDPKCPMANGQSIYKAERAGTLFAAAWHLPFGTKVLVRNPANGKSVMVVILDRGPNKRLNRGLDLCKKAFSKIADTRKGVILAEVKIQ